MTTESGVPNVSPPSALPHHERAAEMTDGLEVRESSDNPNLPPTYRIVRAGRAWTTADTTATESGSVEGHEPPGTYPPRGEGRGRPASGSLCITRPTAEIFSFPMSGSHRVGLIAWSPDPEDFSDAL